MWWCGLTSSISCSCYDVAKNLPTSTHFSLTKTQLVCFHAWSLSSCSCSVVNNLSSLTQSHTWRILFIVIWVMSRILITSYAMWLGRTIVCFCFFFSLLSPCWFHCSGMSVSDLWSSLCMSSHFPVLPSIIMRLLSTRLLEGFGTYPV